MDRKVLQESRFRPESLQADKFRFPTFREIGAIAEDELLLQVEILRQAEGPPRFFQRADTVHAVHAERRALHAPGDDVPALGEFLDPVRVDMETLRLVAAVFPVFDEQFLPFHHRLHRPGEILVAGRDVLHGDTAAQALLAEREQTVDGEGVDQPVHGLAPVDGALVERVGVGAPVADDLHPEQFRDGRAVVVEGPAGVLLPETVAVKPGDPPEGEAGGARIRQGLDEPDIGIDQVGDHACADFRQI